MRPGVLFGVIFIWLVCTGGRFTAPFLEAVAKFNESLIGVTFGLEVLFGSIFSSLGSMKADQIERKYPRKGRIACMMILIVTATVSFQLHYLIYYFTNKQERNLDEESEQAHSAILFHIILRIVYSVSISIVFPIIDGEALSHLQETNANEADYGKERKFGAISWALFSILIGPLIDKFGFHVFFWCSPISCILCVCTLRMYMNHSRNIVDDGRVVEIEMSDLNETSRDNAPSERMESPVDKPSNDQREWQSMMILKSMFSTFMGLGFIISMITLNMGTSIVERLIFLFFSKQLNGTNTICGLTVLVTVLFEIPVFDFSNILLSKYGPNVLQKAACVAYIVRVVGYTFIPKNHVALVLFLEPLHGVTYGLAKTSSVEFAARLSPTGFESTGQGLISMLQGLGSVIGLSLGGWIEETYSPVILYRCYALIVMAGLSSFCIFTCSAHRYSSQEERQRYSRISKNSFVSTDDHDDDDVNLDST